jgi:hypothetical protein
VGTGSREENASNKDNFFCASSMRHPLSADLPFNAGNIRDKTTGETFS